MRYEKESNIFIFRKSLRMTPLVAMKVDFISYESIYELKHYTDWKYVNLITSDNELEVMKGY